jgi:hypothetical protein
VALYEKRQVCVLVKAQPQPSKKYEETVCVAAVTLDHRLLRLYPVRFRHLDQSRRFNRFDWLDVEVTRAAEDPRPESYKLKEDRIFIRRRHDQSSPAENALVWLPAVSRSMAELEELQRTTGRSLGIIRPEPASVRFKYQPIARATAEVQATTQLVYQQASLLEPALKPLAAPEYVFRYEFECGGKDHVMQLHDWEVQATFHAYKKKYGPRALEMMTDFYQEKAPARNLHLIMGTMQKRAYQFICIGVLRTTADLGHVADQGNLFGDVG